MGNKHLTQRYGDNTSEKVCSRESACTSDQLMKRMRRYFEAHSGGAGLEILGSPKLFASDVLGPNDGVMYFREFLDETPDEGKSHQFVLTTVGDDGSASDLTLKFGYKASQWSAEHTPITILYNGMEVNVDYLNKDVSQGEAEIMRLIKHPDFNMKPFRKVFSLLTKSDAFKL